MKKNKKRIINVSLVLAIVLVVALAFHYIHQNQKTLDNQFKKDYQSGNRVAQLYDLLGSDRYAKELRKAGYKIPNDGGIRYDGFIDSVEIDKQLKLDIFHPAKNAKEINVSLSPTVDGKTILVNYSFDRDLKTTYQSFNWIDEKKVNQEISISELDNQCLQKKVRQEIDDFLDTMYHQIYD